MLADEVAQMHGVAGDLVFAELGAGPGYLVWPLQA